MIQVSSKVPSPQIILILVIASEEIVARVRLAADHKCPRCWSYTRGEDETLCKRCSGAIAG